MIERDLAELVLSHPDDPAPYFALADWLQSQGDPRGELIAVQLALSEESEQERRELLVRRERELFQENAEAWGVAPAECARFEWQWGLIRSAAFHGTRMSTELEPARRALTGPFGLYVQELDIAGSPGILQNFLSDSSPRRLRRLTLRDTGGLSEKAREQRNAYDLTPTQDALRHLEYLDVRPWDVDLGNSPFPSLRELVLSPERPSLENIRALADDRWPVLESLTLGFSVSYTIQDGSPEYTRLMREWNLPALKHLHLLTTGGGTRSLAKRIAYASWAGRLETLRIEPMLSRRDAQRLCQLRDRFPALKQLHVYQYVAELDGGNEALREQLAAAFGDVLYFEERETN